jgi:hypothetical protein
VSDHGIEEIFREPVWKRPQPGHVGQAVSHRCARGQAFDKLPPGTDPPGPEVTDEDGNPKGFRFPWVYMGPGVFFNRTTGRVHIRLSPTTNTIEGLTDYQGPDPREVGLAISHKDRTTLVVGNSSFLRLENLSIRFGGEHTVRIHHTKGARLALRYVLRDSEESRRNPGC